MSVLIFVTSWLCYSNTPVQYSWLSGWLHHAPDTPDVKINIISPATDVHVQKVESLILNSIRDAGTWDAELVVVLNTTHIHGPRNTRALWEHREAVYPSFPTCENAVVRIRFDFRRYIGWFSLQDWRYIRGKVWIWADSTYRFISDTWIHSSTRHEMGLVDSFDTLSGGHHSFTRD